ncbi:MAG TPA: GNAT family N-acetyltransferase [Steroidobacteraceae bacterium]|nr:GNAT family N-acetyltransferase [Steroidobacteraceae bacterium]
MGIDYEIRAATEDDVSQIARIVALAYAHYLPRIGKPPGPMLDNYERRVADGVVWVIAQGQGLAGFIVLISAPDHLLLDNVAVAPDYQGRGFGRRLLAFAESFARGCGYREIRLYTHERMVESQRLYARLGYEETDRRTEAGYSRVFMRERLPDRETAQRPK